MIHISEQEMTIVCDIIQRYAADCEVLAFGSRYKGNHKKFSDLDLAFIAPAGAKLGLKRAGQLEDAFSESDLPYRVDVVDYNGLSEGFRKIVDDGNESIPTPCPSSPPAPRAPHTTGTAGRR